MESVGETHHSRKHPYMVSLAKERGLSASSEESLLKKFPEVTCPSDGWIRGNLQLIISPKPASWVIYMGDENYPFI